MPKRQLLLLAEAGTWTPQVMWAAQALARHELDQLGLSVDVDCRLFSENGTGTLLGLELARRRHRSVLWLPAIGTFEFECLGYDLIVVVEPGQHFRTAPYADRYGLADGYEDFEPTSLELGLQRLNGPVIRFWLDSDLEEFTPIAHDYNRGRAALVRFPMRAGDVECARALAGVILSSASRPIGEPLDRDELQEWVELPRATIN